MRALIFLRRCGKPSLNLLYRPACDAAEHEQRLIYRLKFQRLCGDTRVKPKRLSLCYTVAQE